MAAALARARPGGLAAGGAAAPRSAGAPARRLEGAGGTISESAALSRPRRADGASWARIRQSSSPRSTPMRPAERGGRTALLQEHDDAHRRKSGSRGEVPAVEVAQRP